ncbi:hypothetical protein CNR22_07450 [Sphingobacteriaceae bacterium]|nr:hypothetical protein CNR22_07450 [Sphingobacteriaceae bacterium]
MKFDKLFSSINQENLKKPTVIFFIFSLCFSFWFIDFWKPYNTAKNHNNFNWDIMNYYSYLPAKFCNNNSFDFHMGADSLYLPVGPLGYFVPKATYGMSAMYSPFFALGYKVAVNQNSPLTGFSEPFATCVRWGSIFYVLLGLFFLRQLLLVWFNELVTAITLFAVLFGTLLFNYTFSQSEMTHGYLFCLFSIFLYLTHKWHLEQRYLYTVFIGIVFTMISLIRPTEIFVCLFFILWNIRKPEDFKIKVSFFLRNYKHILLILAIGVLMWIPQFLFWKDVTGMYVYYPYFEEGFFWKDPQILNILFSYRKGWITYTPMIVMAFIGFFFVKKEFPVSKWAFIFITCLMIYVLSCWWDWAFGGCFGAREFCQQIAFLAIPIAYFVDFVFYSPKHPAVKGLLSLLSVAFIFSCVFLNIGQTYQYNHQQIHPMGMTEKLYWKVFRQYQFNDHFPEDYWGNVKIQDYEKTIKGKERDNK